MGSWIEFHIHTNEGSSDAFIELEELINEAIRLGLDGICVSEHYDYFDFDENSYEKIYKSYYELCEMAKDSGLHIFPSVEIKVYDDTEYLIHGLIIPEKFFKLGWDEFLTSISYLGGIVVQAHPFRKNNIESKVDGIELYNMMSNDDANQRATQLYLKNEEQIYIIGSDAHFVDELGQAVVIFNKNIQNNNDLINAIKEKDYKGFVVKGEFYEAESFIRRFE